MGTDHEVIELDSQSGVYRNSYLISYNYGIGAGLTGSVLDFVTRTRWIASSYNDELLSLLVFFDLS